MAGSGEGRTTSRSAKRNRMAVQRTKERVQQPEADDAHMLWLQGKGGGAERPVIDTRARLRYRFDATIARGTTAVIAWMFVVAFVFIFVLALVLTALNLTFAENHPGLPEIVWQSLLRFLDAGTMGGDAGWRRRIVALAITIGGIFLAGSLIGLISAGIDSRIEQLRKGRSLVVEQGHVVILGWSQRIFIVVAEMFEAFENEPGKAIVVLAAKDKTWMEDEIRDRVGTGGHTSVVCRTGDTANLADLALVNIDDASGIVVLSDEDREGDAQVIKTVLAVRARGAHLDGVPIVAEFGDREAGAALADAAGGTILPVNATEVVAQVTAQACRQPGLSFVLQDLLSFVGDEIYLEPAPQLEGRTYREALLAYDTSSIIGVVAADGTPELNPPPDRVFAAGEKVVAISEDDDTVIFSGLRSVEEVTLPSVPAAAARESLLVIGWSDLGAPVLSILDGFVDAGSTVDLLVEAGRTDEVAAALPPLEKLTCTLSASSGRAEELASLARTGTYSSVILLGSRYGVSASEADARTLFSLLLLDRGFKARPEAERPRIVAELLESQDVELARVTGADDFVASDALASLMMTQLALDPARAPIFEDLFDADGMAMNVKTAAKYVPQDAEISWGDVVAAAAARSESALGYRLTVDGQREATIVLNPPKSARVTFDHDDHIIVIGLTE